MNEADYRSIEIYYDIASIPEKFKHPLDFRNVAMELIEAALLDQNAGEWGGAEIGMGEVNFGFEVEDFEKAESIVRAAVTGTDFEGIREITRFEMTDEEMQVNAQAVAESTATAPKVRHIVWFLVKHMIGGLFRRNRG